MPSSHAETWPTQYSKVWSMWCRRHQDWPLKNWTSVFMWGPLKGPPCTTLCMRSQQYATRKPGNGSWEDTRSALNLYFLPRFHQLFISPIVNDILNTSTWVQYENKFILALSVNMPKIPVLTFLEGTVEEFIIPNNERFASYRSCPTGAILRKTGARSLLPRLKPFTDPALGKKMVVSRLWWHRGRRVTRSRMVSEWGWGLRGNGRLSQRKRYDHKVAVTPSPGDSKGLLVPYCRVLSILRTGTFLGFKILNRSGPIL